MTNYARIEPQPQDILLGYSNQRDTTPGSIRQKFHAFKQRPGLILIATLALILFVGYTFAFYRTKSIIPLKMNFGIGVGISTSSINSDNTKTPTAQQAALKANQLTRHAFVQNISHDDTSVGRFYQSFYINEEFYRPGGPIWRKFTNTNTITPVFFKNFLYRTFPKMKPGSEAFIPVTRYINFTLPFYFDCLVFCHGEIPADPSRIQKSELQGFAIDLVEKTGGIIALVEMRYYGNSTIFSSLETEKIQYLTTNNILSDFARFIKQVDISEYSNKYKDFILSLNQKTGQKSEQNRGSVDIRGNGIIGSPSSASDSDDDTSAYKPASWRQKWFYHGSSLAGSLAQWMRIKYPDLVFAAYASSGPVEITPAYFHSDIAIYSGLPCTKKVANAVDLIDRIFSSNSGISVYNRGDTLVLGKQQIKEIFGYGDMENDVDFLYLISTVLSRIVATANPPKYPSKTKGGLLFIKGKNENDEPVSRDARFCSFFKLPSQPNQFDNLISYANGFKASLLDPKAGKLYRADTVARTSIGNDLSSSGQRPWLWLVCNEFGGFPVSARPFGYSSTSVVSKFITIDYFWDQCRQWFGFGPSYDHLSKLNTLYGGKRIKVDQKTVYVEGEMDPTYMSTVVQYQFSFVSRNSTGSFTSKPPSNVISIPGGYHHSELMSPSEHNNTDLKKAQDTIINFFVNWSLE